MGHRLKDLARQSFNIRDLQALVQIWNDISQEEIRICINMRNQLQAVIKQRGSNIIEIYTQKHAKSIQQPCQDAYPVISVIH